MEKTHEESLSCNHLHRSQWQALAAAGLSVGAGAEATLEGLTFLQVSNAMKEATGVIGHILLPDGLRQALGGPFEAPTPPWALHSSRRRAKISPSGARLWSEFRCQEESRCRAILKRQNWGKDRRSFQRSSEARENTAAIKRPNLRSSAYTYHKHFFCAPKVPKPPAAKIQIP